MESLEELFKRKNIRVTAVRQLVWKVIKQFNFAFSLADVEKELYTVDKSSVFRTIILFKEKGMLHEIDDGSGSIKYCVCDCTDDSHHQHHVHITCTICKKTFCLKTQIVPLVSLPKDFEVEEINYVVKGICSVCQKKLNFSK